jgi:hypothetical protein
MSDKFMLYTYKIKMCKRMGGLWAGVPVASGGL